MKEMFLTLAVLSSVSAFSITLGSDAYAGGERRYGKEHSRSARDYAPGRNKQNFVPPGLAKKRGEPARDYAPGQRKRKPRNGEELECFIPEGCPCKPEFCPES